MAIEKPAEETMEELSPEQESDLSHLDSTQEPPLEVPSETPTSNTEGASKEAAAHTPPETPAKPELPKPKHPAWLRRRALAHDATDEQIDSVDTDTLEAWVEKRELESAELKRPEAKKPDQAGEDEIDWGADEAGNPLTEKDIAPGIAKNIKAMHKKQRETDAALKTIQQREAARQQVAVADACDDAIEALGPAFEKVFGKGSIQALPEGKEKARRQAAFVSAGINPEIDSPTTIKRKLKKAAADLYGDLVEAKPKEPAKESVKEKSQNGYDEEVAAAVKGVTKKAWDEAALAKPTQARPKPSRGEAAAREAVRDYFREHGIKDDSEAKQFEGVPE